MPLSLLAAALLSQPLESHSMTARELYSGCVRVVGSQAALPPATNDATAAAEQVNCEVSIVVKLAERAANEAMARNDPQWKNTFCPPDSVLDDDDSTQQLARAYIAWFDRHPGIQDAADGDATLEQALRQTWPCPR